MKSLDTGAQARVCGETGSHVFPLGHTTQVRPSPGEAPHPLNNQQDPVRKPQPAPGPVGLSRSSLPPRRGKTANTQTWSHFWVSWAAALLYCLRLLSQTLGR